MATKFDALKPSVNTGGLWGRGFLAGAEIDPSGYQFYCYMSEACIDTTGGAGVITGVDSGNIYKPPHVFKHFAWKVAKSPAGSSSDFRSSGFGSFATAVTDLDDKVASGDWEMLLRVLKPLPPSAVINRITTQCPVTIFRGITDDKWAIAAYQQSPSSEKYFTDVAGATYKWKYSTDMVDGTVRAYFTDLDECANEVHIKYAMFAPTGEFTKDAWVGPSGSDNGAGTRDQNTAAPDNREALATDSRDDYNVKRVLTIEADTIVNDNVAVALRNYYFDRFRRPRLVLEFQTGPRGLTLEPGMATLVDNELQDFIPCPWYPGSGSAKEWDDIIFFVRSNTVVVGGEYPYMCNVVLEEIA